MSFTLKFSSPTDKIPERAKAEDETELHAKIHSLIKNGYETITIQTLKS